MTTREFIDGVIKKCKGAGGFCSEPLVTCDGTIPDEVVADGLRLTTWARAVSLDREVAIALATEEPVAAELLTALVENGRLLISSGAGVIQFLDHARQVIDSYRYEFTTAREGSGVAIKIMFGDVDGPLTSSISGRTLMEGRAGFLRISDGAEREFSWDLSHRTEHERFTWAR